MRVANSGLTGEQPHVVQRKERASRHQWPVTSPYRLWLASMGGNKSYSYVQAVSPSLFRHCYLKGNLSNEGQGGDSHSPLQQPQRPAACVTLYTFAITWKGRSERRASSHHTIKTCNPHPCAWDPRGAKGTHTTTEPLASAQQRWRGFPEETLSEAPHVSQRGRLSQV